MRPQFLPLRAEFPLHAHPMDLQTDGPADPLGALMLNEAEPRQVSVATALEKHADGLAPRVVVQFDEPMVVTPGEDQGGHDCIFIQYYDNDKSASRSDTGDGVIAQATTVIATS